MDDERRSMIGQLRELRERLRLSQEQLAQRLGVSFATVNRWEGGRATPSARSKARLEQMLRQATAAAHGAGPRPGDQPDLSDLPGDLRPFIGRARELGTLRELWAGCRTLTLTGAGGIGKSRLAAELLRRSGDPVLGVVQLDAVRDPGLVPAALAMALGVRGRPNVPERVGIVTALRDLAGVLFLDTCEHVAEPVRDLLLHVLGQTSGIRVLATSQVPLGLPGEQVWRVPGLRLAEGADPADSDAVRFFLARARERSSAFGSDPATVEEVAEICARLDGIPLALGLAAGWMGTLTPAELLRRWASRAELLADPTAEQERHRTLASAIEWSSALLTPADRQLVAELSVFVGPFDIDDTEAVVSQAATPETATPEATGSEATGLGAIESEVVSGQAGAGLLARVRRLVDVSWLEFVPGPGPAHFLMLDPLRGWGLRLLEQSGLAEQCRRRHARQVRDRCRQAEAARFGLAPGRWPQRLELMSGSIQAAVAWCASADQELGAEIAVRLLGWWRQSGRLAEGRHWSRTFRESLASPLWRARAGCAESLLALDIGDYQDVERLANQALPVLERHGDPVWTARALTALSSAAKYRGHMDTARKLLERALTHQRRHGDQHELASTLNNLGSLTADQHDLEAAEHYCRLSLDIKRGLGDARSLALTMANLADVYTQGGRLTEAGDLLADAMSLVEPLGEEFVVALLRINLGENLMREGDHVAAVAPFRQALDYAALTGASRFQALAACGLGQALCAIGDTGEGVRLLRESRRAAQRMGDEILLAQVQAALAKATTGQDREPPPGRLSVREVQVLEHVSGGLTNREIAERLHLRPATVQRHLANIYTKLNVRNRTEAARRGLELGLWPRDR